MKETKEKNITPLLAELCYSYRERYSEKFYPNAFGSEYLDRAEKRMEEIAEQAAGTEKKRDVFNEIYYYGCEYYEIGFIDGFKMAKWLMDELTRTGDEGFLKELLQNV